MSISGLINNAPSFLSWFGVVPSGTSVTEAYGDFLSEIAQSPWLSKSEKERVEDLLLSGSLVIPPPQINIAAFQDIALNFRDHFALTALAATGSLAGFGIAECAITLAALGAWAQSQNFAEKDLVQALLSSGSQNPLEVALKKYIEKGTITSVDGLNAQLLLRKMAVLQAALRTVSPDIILKAFLLAEQQLILALLLNWGAMEAKISAYKKEILAKQEIYDTEIARQILSEYVLKAQQKQDALKQPVVSMLLGMLVADPSIVIIVNSILPFSGVTIGTNVIAVPAALVASLNVIAAGVLSSTMLWSAPVAMSLIAYTPGISGTLVSKECAKAFATALAVMISNPAFSALLTSTLDQAVAKGLISQNKAVTISASFKASLLLTAMALLYKSETGGYTAGELRAIITGEIKTGPDDFLGVLAKLINEQLNMVAEADRDALLTQLLTPFDQDLPIEELLSPMGGFVAGWDPSCIRESTLASPG